MNLIEFPSRSLADVAGTLRILADSIAEGGFGEALAVSWVIDCGRGRIEVGHIGLAGVAGAEAHFLLALGQRKLEAI